MLNIKNLTKSYDGKNNVVEKLNLDIESGLICGLLGLNGAGKTTTLKMITGILNPDEGDVLIDNISISANPISAKQKFAFVPDNPNLFFRLKGIEYLNFVANIYKVSKDERIKKIKELAAKFDLENALNDKISTYSHGMRQKIHLIAALLHNPPVWILDEPMTGLDPKAAFLLKTLMREHADQGNLVLFSTHVLEVAEKICDVIAIIDKGEIKFYGTIEQMKQHLSENKSLEEMFFAITEA